MPRKNKPHSERRRKTKRYRNKNIRLDTPEPKKYKSWDDDNIREIEEFGWEEYNGAEEDGWR